MEGKLAMQDDPLRTENTERQSPGWVKFNEENNSGSEGLESSNRTETKNDDNSDQHHAAVIETSVSIVPTVQIQSPSKIASSQSSSLNAVSVSNNHKLSSPNVKSDKPPTFVNVSNLEIVELRNSETSLNDIRSASASGAEEANLNGRSSVRRAGFINGVEIVSVLPMNSRLPWITPANFRPELVPEELMSESLTLTVEEYVHIMEILTSDFRFNLYIICYKRLLAAWLATAFFVLLIILFSGVGGIGLFAMGITWLLINAAAVFLCMYIKIKINKGLERCMGKVNRLLLKHKLLVGVDDRGKLSCHKIQLSFIYFDATECIKRLGQVLDGSNDRARLQRHLDATDVDIVIGSGANSRRISASQNGERLFLRYVQRYLKDFLRKRLDWTPTENPVAPLHLTSALCPCQYPQSLLLRYTQPWLKDFLRELATSTQSVPPSHIPGPQLCPCQYALEMLEEKKITGGYKNCFTIFGSSSQLDPASPGTAPMHI